MTKYRRIFQVYLFFKYIYIYIYIYIDVCIYREKDVYIYIYIDVCVAEPISMSTPQMNYVNENSQSNMKEQRRDNNYNK